MLQTLLGIALVHAREKKGEERREKTADQEEKQEIEDGNEEDGEETGNLDEEEKFLTGQKSFFLIPARGRNCFEKVTLDALDRIRDEKVRSGHL